MGYITGQNKISQIVVDADLVMGAHNITLGAGQTVDGKDVGAIIELNVKATDNLRVSIDAEVYHSTATYTKKRTLTFTNGIKGVLRIKFERKGTLAETYYHILTQNGATPGTGHNIGTEQTHEGDNSYVGHQSSQDVTVDIPAGETIDLWMKRTGASGSVYVKELRFYWLISIITTGGD